MPLIIIFSIHPFRVFAFDPFTAMTMANSAAGFLNSAKGISDTVGDLSQFSDFLGLASETMDESNGLANDLGYESDASDLDQKVQNLEALNSKLRDIKWNSEDLKYTLDSDINSTKSLSQKIRQMRKLISISKKLAGAFGLKTKGADKVATLQQVKINSMMLDELQSMRKIQLLGYLEDKGRTANQDIYLNRIISEETSKNQSRRSN
ncbi:MAG: hypothetical protein WA160_16105 [Pseudobdellovibrio sp.]